MIPLWNEAGSTRPMGMPMCQNRLAVPIWSYAMEVLPPRQIIEIGSYNGAFATALGLHARAIGASITTYDINPQAQEIVEIGQALGVRYRACDVWQALSEIALIIKHPGTTFILCDGGDKPRELDTFAGYAKPGDVIAAHDYDAVAERGDHHVPSLDRPWPWCETRKADGDRIAAARGLVPWMQEHFDLAGWLAYQKR